MTVTSSGSRLWIKASPRGSRSGFAVLPDGAGGRVTVTVMPKPWSSKTRAVRDYAHPPGTTTHVVMNETDLVAISTSPASIGSLAISLADVGRAQADLLALGSPTDDPLRASISGVDPFQHLVDLTLLAERGSLMESPLTFEGAFAPSLLRLLSHERLLSAVESLIFRVRPRYTELTEMLSTPRGRLSAESLLFSLTTGTPRVESTFDELTTDTPLLQIIASALRVISNDRLPSKITALRPGTQTRAVHLLHLLAGVTLVERERALLAAERLWLGPLDQIWRPAIDAAVPVLRDWAVVPESGYESTDAVLVHISTEKFWEQCLELALRGAFSDLAVSRDARAAEGVSTPAPWVPRTTPDADPSEPDSTSFPDFMFRAGGRVVVADAKYKLRAGGTPSSSDAYQLFAYSHLATLGGQPAELAAILYPTHAARQPSQVPLARMRDRSHSLWLVHLPFPTQRELQRQGSWTVYVAHLASTMREFSTDWFGWPISQRPSVTIHGGHWNRFRANAAAYLREHQENAALQRLRHNQELTDDDWKSLVDMLVASGGDQGVDLMWITERAGALGPFIRSLVGLERSAVVAAFAEVLENPALSAEQRIYVSTIVDEISTKGMMEPRRLSESPYAEQGRLDVVFPMDHADILELIRSVNAGR